MTVSSDPAHIDNIGGSLSFEVEAWGFLNHPPRITSASIDPAHIPDDGSIQPLITCIPSDEDGNINRITVDLSTLGGSYSSSTRMYDDGGKAGTGDEIADDGKYSYKIRKEIPVGEWTFKITARDSKLAEAYANVSIRVDPLSEFTESPKFKDHGVFPGKVPNDSFTPATIWAIVEDQENDIVYVIADLTALGGEKKQDLNDDGNDGDIFSRDGNYSYQFTVGPLVPLDIYQIEIKAIDATGHESIERVWVDVVLPPVPPVISDILVDPDTAFNNGEDKVQVIATVVDDNDDVDHVYVDLTPLRGPKEAPMEYEGRDTWSIEFTIPNSVSAGLKGKIDITAIDRTELSITESFAMTVEKANSAPEIFDHYVSSDEVRPGEVILVKVNVSDADLDTLSGEVILTEFSISNIELLDDGDDPDQTAGDLTFTGKFQVPQSTDPGSYNITLRIWDMNGADVTVKVQIIVSLETVNEGVQSNTDLLFIGLPVAFLVILVILIVAGYSKKKRQQAPQGPPMAPLGRRPMPPPGAIMAGQPMGHRPMR